MEFLGDVVDWFSDPDNWTGSGGVLFRLQEHVTMCVTAMVAAILLALPVGVWLGHRRRWGGAAINISNVGRALPSFGILAFGVAAFGIGDYPLVGSLTTFIALVALAVPPIVTNAYVGMSEVDDDIRDAARGMGLGERQMLLGIELPLAMPLIMAGVRTSAVQVVATATIAAYVGWGGLGVFITHGIAIQDYPEVFAGAVLVASLALLTELGLGLVQRWLTPRALRGAEPLVAGSAADVALSGPSMEAAA
jgi:osmoprotectant transport system permease protein